MTYTNEEYAEMAIKANEEGKVLKIIKGKLTHVESEPIALSDEQVKIQNQSIIKSLLTEANTEIEVLNDKIELDIVTDEDLNLLKKWKLYRINLKSIDPNKIELNLPKKP